MVGLRVLIALSLAIVRASCAAPATAAPTVRLTLTDFKYSQSIIEMAADQKVAFELKNEGSVEHDIVIDAIGFKVSVQPGKTAMRNLGPLKAGEYDIVCTVPGHKELGMVGKLIVR